MESKRVFDTGRVRFSFTDSDGAEFAHFTMDPGSPTLSERAERAAEFFGGLGPGANVACAGEVEGDWTISEKATVYDIKPERRRLPKIDELSGVALDRRIEAEICALIGYDASEELFSVVRPTSVSADGEMFAVAILEAIAEQIAPELLARREKLAAAVARYTDKYRGEGA